MSSRENILGAIRRDRPAPLPLPDVPMFDDGRDDDLLGRFGAAFTMMGGTMLEMPADGDPMAAIRDRVAKGGVVISMVPEVAGTMVLDPDLLPSKLDTVDIAIVRAAFGVAETGSICLTERELGVNTLAYLAQHLIVLLDPADLLVNIHHAYHRPEIHEARYCVFHTGPSATADIEGVLILGAQGVRSLSILALPRS